MTRARAAGRLVTVAADGIDESGDQLTLDLDGGAA